MTSQKKRRLPDAATEFSALLTRALGLEQTLHQEGVRDCYRQLLVAAAELAEQALLTADPQARPQTMHTLLRTQTARAQDARHGAGQLSRGAQRAPTSQDCDDGWMRVEEIVRVAESCAMDARRLAEDLNSPEAVDTARVAEEAARDARDIILARNHAFTFHAHPGFSFGEGWYAAAAALLAGVLIQIEPDSPQSEQAERFLRDAGLGHRIVPYRPRPRANKQLTAIVAEAFASAPISAQDTLRRAFLGDEPPEQAIVEWCRHRVGSFSGDKILVWVRNGRHDSHRNTPPGESSILCRCVIDAGLVPVLFGDALPEGAAPPDAVDLTLSWKEPLFQGPETRRSQLQLIEELKREHGVVGQLGVTTAGMDGPALLGLPTMYLTDSTNVRMRRWVGTIPGYQEVTRTQGYLEIIETTLKTWTSAKAVQAAPR